MKGTICCNRCGKTMPDNGVCPSCQTARCHIEIYHDEKPWKFYRTKKKVLHGYDSALDDLLTINRQIKEGKFKPSEWVTGKLDSRKIKNVFHLWLAAKDKEVKDGTMSPGGVAPYRSYTKQHFIPFFGEMDIEEAADKQVIKDFHEVLKEKPIKHKMIKNILSGLHAFFEWALDSKENYISAVPPFPTIKVADATPQQALDEDTQQKGLSSIPTKYRDPFIVMFDMCLRVGETVAFRVKDYVPEYKGIWVQRTESKNQIKENTKADKKVCMKLTDDALMVIAKHIRGRFNDKCLEEWLFINPDTGRRYTVKKLGQIWKRYSGVKVKLYEGGRHSSLTHLAATGDAYLVRDAARHSDIRTSQKYVHASQERLRRALNARKKSYTGRARVEVNND